MAPRHQLLLKIEYAAFVANARPTETGDTHSCSAEQGNRVRIPDMCWAETLRLSSCDCGALFRAQKCGLRKRVIGTAVMVGREGRKSALGQP